MKEINSGVASCAAQPQHKMYVRMVLNTTNIYSYITHNDHFY